MRSEGISLVKEAKMKDEFSEKIPKGGGGRLPPLSTSQVGVNMRRAVAAAYADALLGRHPAMRGGV